MAEDRRQTMPGLPDTEYWPATKSGAPAENRGSCRLPEHRYAERTDHQRASLAMSLACQTAQTLVREVAGKPSARSTAGWETSDYAKGHQRRKTHRQQQ